MEKKNIDGVYDIPNFINFRRARGLTQQQLAEKAGLNIATIQRFEQGRVDPSQETINKICVALDIQARDIIKREYRGEDDLVHFRGPVSRDDCLAYEIDWLKGGGGAHLGSELGREAALLVAFEALNEAGQRTVLDMISIVSKVDEYKKA